MRWIAFGIVLGLVVVLAGCSTAPPRCTCPCHDRHAAVANADLGRAQVLGATYPRPAGGGSSTTARTNTRTVSKATTSKSRSSSRRYRPTARTSYSGYVRLRGSVPIHLVNCPLVRKAAPGGATPAGKNDGPPCFTCRRSEALAAER